MSNRKKAEFTDKTRRILAGRAGYQCSFPDCKLFLIGPHSDGEKTQSLGVAAHIEGAAAGSARYDIEQTDMERKHISNGIWMCWNHSVQIDNDEHEYPVELLESWRSNREKEASSQFGNPIADGGSTNMLDRPEEHLRVDTDGKYRSSGMIISFDPWLSDGMTMVKLSAEGELSSRDELVSLAVNSVKAYMVSVGLRGQYLHMLAQMRKLKLHPISRSFPPQWESQFDEFNEDMRGIDWSDTPGMEGSVFDLVAGDVKGNGVMDIFMIDITCLYPHIYSHYMDNREENRDVK